MDTGASRDNFPLSASRSDSTRRMTSRGPGDLKGSHRQFSARALCLFPARLKSGELDPLMLFAFPAMPGSQGVRCSVLTSGPCVEMAGLGDRCISPFPCAAQRWDPGDPSGAQPPAGRLAQSLPFPQSSSAPPEAPSGPQESGALQGPILRASRLPTTHCWSRGCPSSPLPLLSLAFAAELPATCPDYLEQEHSGPAWALALSKGAATWQVRRAEGLGLGPDYRLGILWQ